MIILRRVFMAARLLLVGILTAMSYRLQECPLCGGQDLLPLMSARDYHYGNPGEFTLAQCAHCTLAFLHPMYEEAELAAFYPKDYYAFTDRFSVSERGRNRPKFWKLLRPPHSTKDPTFARPGKMLDIGCGSGLFLAQMRDRGWEVQGVEPNPGAAALGRNQKGLDIFPGLLIDANFPARSFDYVRLNNAFEHMEHPNQVLHEVYRILADDGKIMIGVPNRDGWNARMFGRFWYHLAPPVHTFGYSVRTLTRMLEKHNFQVEQVTFNTEQTSLLGGVQIYLNRNQASPSFDGRLRRNRVAKFLAYEAARLQNILHVSDVIEVTASKRAKDGSRDRDAGPGPALIL